MSHVQMAVLCDVCNKQKTSQNVATLLIPFVIFSPFEEILKELMKDEKKHHGTNDKSSLKQQFLKSDAILLLCEISGAICTS